MQADSKKPEVGMAQVVLAALAETLLEEKLSETGITRIEERGKLTSAEKHLSGVAQSAGLSTGLKYAIFKDAGFRGMYNMSLKQLQGFKGAESGKTLYDFMGITELAANTFRVTQTAERMKKNNVKGINESVSTAQEVGKEVRGIMLKSSGTAPENLPLEGHISTVKRQIKSTHKKMKKLDGELSKDKKK
jgi:DNA-damage-inducible protein D